MAFKLLTVGDGDLSFSLALKRAYPQLSVTATTLLDSPSELIRTYSNSANIIDEFQNHWKETIVYGVNATRIQDHSFFTSKHELFDIVIFNHPHLGSSTLLESEEKHATRHHVLISHYFASAKAVLKPNGVVHLCLCGNQPQTWNIANASKNNSLHLLISKSIDCPIDSWLFPKEVEYKLANVEDHYRAKRKFRNGKLGSKHFLSRYGYMHRRTEGERFEGNEKEMNVGQSVNLVFGRDLDEESSSLTNDDELMCSVCRMVFDSEDELAKHLENPALPDVQTDNEVEISTNDGTASKKIKSAETPKPAGQSHKQPPIQPINLKNATILSEATVSTEFHSTRIKWTCRQPTFPLSQFIKSKKQCEEAIKQGRVYVNQKVAFDTGRIVYENDVVALIEKYEPLNKVDPSTAEDEFQLTSGVRIIRAIRSDENAIPSYVVVYKPVGMRCAGQFTSDTLEMIIKCHYEKRYQLDNIFCQSLSKIETGCAGLCVLKICAVKTDMVLPKIMYTFTVLVRGSPDESWKSGVYTTISSGNRNWKKQKISLGEDSTAISTTQTQLDLSEALFIQSQDTYNINEGSTRITISTLTIKSNYDNGRLANTISYTLRKLGYPVVNDRFAKRESAALPRRMKNLLKQKVCIGCYRVDIVEEGGKGEDVVSIDPHNRTQCRYWMDLLGNGSSTKL